VSFTTRNHYVPQWYQYLFIPPGLREKKFFYLDKDPEKRPLPGGRYYFRDACRRLGPINCFMQDHLYTLIFGEQASDIVEKSFFGKIDETGAGVIEAIAEYDPHTIPRNGLSDFTRYLDAQKLRTPKGLDYLRRLTRSGSHQEVLYAMRQLWQVHATIWTEGVWEILQCDNTETKFIISDHPVTTYNRELFPLAIPCRYPLDAPIELLGTHTIFPLKLNRCLVITNLGYVRNPRVNPCKERENSRYFENTIKDIRKIQTGRQLSESEVCAINYIIKTRAKRYVAAADEEWLYPEHHLKTTMWNKLADRFFLMPDPRKVSFSTGIFIGGKDGSSWATDEYGRPVRDDDPQVEKLRDKEWDTFQKAKQAWDQKFGKLTRDEMVRYF